MTWAAPVTFVAGTVCTAGNLNILSADLTGLTGSIPLFGVTPAAMAGTPPATITPGQYRVQVGAANAATNGSGTLAVAFPLAFPNGLVVVNVSPWWVVGTTNAWTQYTLTTVSASGFTFSPNTPTGGSLISEIIGYSYTAIGF